MSTPEGFDSTATDGASLWIAPDAGLELRELTIEIDPRDPAEPGPEARSRWEAMRTERPRLFNGPILAFMSFDARTRTVRVRRDHYMHLAVRPEVETGVTQTSVTGVIAARDALGERHILLGKRSGETRIYDGLWELAPSGGLDPIDASVTRMDGEDAWRQLLVEIEEELELSVAPDPGRVLALTHDAIANAMDIVLSVELARPLEDVNATAGRLGWEYETTRWIPAAQLRAFAKTEPVIPPTAGLADAV